MPVDPTTLSLISSLELRAKLIVEGFYHGIHRSPYHGFSVEFSEYRQYTPGDDIRHIDWRAFARTDRHYIKKYEDETNLRCRLLVDQSKSMSYRSSETHETKSRYAATLAATLAHFLSQQGDAVGLTTFDQDITNILPTRNRPGHLRRLMLLLEKESNGTATDFAPPLEKIAQMHQKRGLFILITDLLAPLTDLESRLGFLRARGNELVIFQILDPREKDFNLPNSAQYIDLETETQFHIDPATAKKQYQEKFAAHQSQIETLCARQNIQHILLETTSPLDQALHKFLTTRNHQTPAPLRATNH
jgi:uncharacterized protein (DUF58 family)